MRLDSLANEIQQWGARTFPNATPASIAAHLYDESVELAQAQDVDAQADEGADLFILLVQHARLAGYDLAEAVERKHGVNLRRVWGPPDARGVVRHVAVGRQ